MMIALLCLQILILAGIAAILREMFTKKNPEPSVATVQPSSEPAVRPEPHRRLCEVLKRHPSGWKHEGWVRDKSEAWQRMYDTPGFALRIGGDIEEGQQ